MIAKDVEAPWFHHNISKPVQVNGEWLCVSEFWLAPSITTQDC